MGLEDLGITVWTDNLNYEIRHQEDNNEIYSDVYHCGDVVYSIKHGMIHGDVYTNDEILLQALLTKYPEYGANQEPDHLGDATEEERQARRDSQWLSDFRLDDKPF